MSSQICWIIIMAKLADYAQAKEWDPVLMHIEESTFTVLKCPFKPSVWKYQEKDISSFRWDRYIFGDDELRLYVHFHTIGEYICSKRGELATFKVFTRDYMSHSLLHKGRDRNQTEYMPYDITLHSESAESSVYRFRHAYEEEQCKRDRRIIARLKHDGKVGLRRRDHVSGTVDDTVIYNNSFSTLPYVYDSDTRLESFQSFEFYSISTPEKTTGPVFFHHAPLLSRLTFKPSAPSMFVSAIGPTSFVIYLECPEDSTIAEEKINRYEVAVLRTYEANSELHKHFPADQMLEGYLSKAKYVYKEKGRRMIVLPVDNLYSSQLYTLQARFQDKDNVFGHETNILIKTLNQSQTMLQKKLPTIKQLKILEVQPRRILMEFTRAEGLQNVKITLLRNSKTATIMENVEDYKVNFTDLQPSSSYTIRVAPGHMSQTLFPVGITLKTPREAQATTERNTGYNTDREERKKNYERKLEKKIELVKARIAKLDEQMKDNEEKLKKRKDKLLQQIADINRRSAAVKKKELKLASHSEFTSRMTSQSIFLSILVIQFSIVVGLIVFVALQFYFLCVQRKK